MAETAILNVAGNAVEQLKKIEAQTKKVSDAFAGLRGALAGLAVGSFVMNAVKMADAMNDLSDATNISMETLIGFSKAVELSGGSAEGAQKAVLKLTQNISEAGNANKELQDSFKEVGVTLQDLATLSEEDILRKTVEGLAKVDDAATRVALSAKLLGKEFRGVSAEQLASMLDKTTAAAGKSAQAYKAAADAQDKFDKAVSNIKDNLLVAIKPLTDFIANLKPEQIEKFSKAVVDIGASLAIIAGAAKAFSVLGTALAGIGASIAAFAVGWKALGASIAAQVARFGALYGVLKQVVPLLITGAQGFVVWKTAAGTLPGVVTPIFGRLSALMFILARFKDTLMLLAVRFLPSLFGALRLLSGPVGLLITLLTALHYALKLAFDIDVVKMFTDGLKDAWAWLVKMYDKAAALVGLGGKTPQGPKMTAADFQKTDKDTSKVPTPATREVTAAVDAYKKLRDELKSITSEYNKQLSGEIQQLSFANAMVGKTEEEKQLYEAIYAVNQRANEQVDELLKKRAEWANGTKEQRASVKQIDDLIADIKSKTEGQIKDVVMLVQQNQTLQLLEKDRLNNIERITEQMEFQKRVAEVTSGIYSDIARQIDDAKFNQGLTGKSQAEMFNMKSPFERQRAEINRNIDQLYASKAGDIMAQFETEDGFRNVEQMNQALAGLLMQTEALRKVQLDGLEASRQWSFGWNEAFEQYVDSATNAADRARQSFSAFTNAMESAIDKFVTTGKFSFGDFAKSVIADLLKIEMKAATMSFLKSMGGGAGIMGSIGSLFGGFFAEGGNPPVGKASIVGERGPELFVPKTAGTIIPNGALGGQQQVSNTYITNNISAVDAKSVAQLFAENRRVLLGATEQARRELPGSTR